MLTALTRLAGLKRLLCGRPLPSNRLERRSVLRSSTLFFAGAFIACRGPDTDRSPDLAASRAQRLVGVWAVRFHLDHPVQLVSHPSVRGVRGTIALIENRIVRSFPELPAALHAGVYDVDFTALGFDPRDRGRVPSAAGRAISDSVDIVLAPGSSGMSVLMRGRFAGDSVVGSWSVLARADGGGGRFVMRRQR